MLAACGYRAIRNVFGRINVIITSKQRQKKKEKKKYMFNIPFQQHGIHNVATVVGAAAADIHGIQYKRWSLT